MKILKTIVLVSLLLYIVPAFFMLAFSSESSKASSNYLEKLIVFSPYIIYLASILIRLTFPNLSNSIVLIISPFFSIFIFVVFAFYMQLQNNRGEEQILSDNSDSLKKVTKLFIDNLNEKQTLYYRVRLISQNKHSQIILLALQEPFSNIKDKWGNLELVPSNRSGVNLWLIKLIGNKVKTFISSGFIENKYIDDYSFSNFGYYKDRCYPTNDLTTMSLFNSADYKEIKLKIDTLNSSCLIFKADSSIGIESKFENIASVLNVEGS